MTLNRRDLLLAGAAFALVGTGVSAALLPFSSPARADDTTASPADLADAGPDGDVMLGSDKAPVTIIEYASMTCPHCAHFSRERRFRSCKKRYIDTGKVRFTLRTFPLDALAAAGFMLARCAGNDKYHADRRNPVRQAGPIGSCKEPVAAAEGNRQAVRLHRRPVQRSAWRIRRCSTASRRCATTPSRSSGSTPRRLSSSTARSWSATSRSTRWPRKSTPISRKDKGFLPPSGRGWPRRTPAGAVRLREGLDNPAARVALGIPTIHSPRRCGTIFPRQGVTGSRREPLTIPSPPRQGRWTYQANEAHAAAPDRLQVLRRTDRLRDRTRTDRRRRPERLRQIQSGRGRALGHGRSLLQGHARRRDGRRHLLRQYRPPGAQPRRSRGLDRQQRPQGAGGLQRFRDARSLAPHHARAGLDLPRQRPRGARPRRRRAVRRRLDRLALARSGAPGPHRRDHPGAARSAPARARRSRRHFRPACAPP